MDSLIDRRLIVVTGKGGVGKTTISAAIGLLAAKRGLHTTIVDAVGDGQRLRRLFLTERRSASPSAPDAQDDFAARNEPLRLAENLELLCIDTEAALIEWLGGLAGRLPAKLLASRGSFQYFAAAAPGAKELVSMLKVSSLIAENGRQARELIVLDAPATGHALAMLDSPRTFASIARVGPIAGQIEDVRELLLDQARTGYLAVAQASEMAVTETLELQAELRAKLGVELSRVIVNATIQRRFSPAELAQAEALAGDGLSAEQRQVLALASAAAQTSHTRTRLQRNQVARLRRHELEVMQLPFVFEPDLRFEDLLLLAEKLEGKV